MDRYDSNRHRGAAGPSDGGPAGDEARFVPILARAAEIGRGPPWLVAWTRSQLARLGSAELAAEPSAIRRLARELARRVRGPGLTDTVPDRPPEGRVGSSLVAPPH